MQHQQLTYLLATGCVVTLTHACTRPKEQPGHSNSLLAAGCPVPDTWFRTLRSRPARGLLPESVSLTLQEAQEGQQPGSGQANVAGDLEQTADLLAAASASTSGHQLPTDPKGEVALEVSVPPGAGDKTCYCFLVLQAEASCVLGLVP